MSRMLLLSKGSSFAVGVHTCPQCRRFTLRGVKLRAIVYPSRTTSQITESWLVGCYCTNPVCSQYREVNSPQGVTTSLERCLLERCDNQALTTYFDGYLVGVECFSCLNVWIPPRRCGLPDDRDDYDEDGDEPLPSTRRVPSPT